MSHTCPVRPCDVAALPNSLLMCKPHWRLVPRPIQNAVTRAYAGGRGLGTGELVQAQDMAIRAVEHKLEAQP